MNGMVIRHVCMKLIVLGLALIFFSLYLSIQAFAQTAESDSTNTILASLVALVGAAIVGLGVFLRKLIIDHSTPIVGEKISEEIVNVWDKAVNWAAEYAMAQANDYIDKLDISLNSPAIRDGVQYLKENVPELIEETKKTDEIVKKNVQARLNKIKREAVIASKALPPSGEALEYVLKRHQQERG